MLLMRHYCFVKNIRRCLVSRRISILGGGIAGISAGYHANLLGIEYKIYESRARLGGLIDNFSINGFRFDNAIHMSFTKNSYVRSLFDQTESYTYPAIPFCYDNGLWVKHPIQNNLSHLSLVEKIKSFKDFLLAPRAHGENYEEWLLSQYGEFIARRYPIPYTKKYWTVEPRYLGTGWISNRMRRANSLEIIRGLLTPATDNHYYAAEMRYPKKGGYRAFVEPFMQNLNVLYEKKLVRLDLSRKKMYFEDGSVEYYESLVSTLPLPELISIIDDIPVDVRIAADTLWATSVDLISVGFNKPHVSPHLWFYIYDTDMLPARCYSPSNKSEDNVPDGCSSLQFEIYSSKHQKNRVSSEGLISNISEIIIKMGLATVDEINFIHHKKIDYANVVFDIGMEKRRDFVKDFLKSNSVQLAGRFGEWDYLWSDQSFISGMNAIKNSFEQT